MNTTFDHALRGLIAGDFSRLAPLFRSPHDGSPSLIIKWFDEGLFVNEPIGQAEALTCASFNGCTDVVEYLLARGADPNGGNKTGLNALHWAANRGQLSTVEILIRHQASLESVNSYGGTVLGCAVWSAVYEPKRDHLEIIEALLRAGADISAARYLSGDERVDDILRRYGAVE